MYLALLNFQTRGYAPLNQDHIPPIRPSPYPAEHDPWKTSLAINSATLSSTQCLPSLKKVLIHKCQIWWESETNNWKASLVYYLNWPRILLIWQWVPIGVKLHVQISVLSSVQANCKKMLLYFNLFLHDVLSFEWKQLAFTLFMAPNPLSLMTCFR
jgi:hypothetical protein